MHRLSSRDHEASNALTLCILCTDKNPYTLFHASVASFHFHGLSIFFFFFQIELTATRFLISRLSALIYRVTVVSPRLGGPRGTEKAIFLAGIVPSLVTSRCRATVQGRSITVSGSRAARIDVTESFWCILRPRCDCTTLGAILLAGTSLVRSPYSDMSPSV